MLLTLSLTPVSQGQVLQRRATIQKQGRSRLLLKAGSVGGSTLFNEPLRYRGRDRMREWHQNIEFYVGCCRVGFLAKAALGPSAHNTAVPVAVDDHNRALAAVGTTHTQGGSCLLCCCIGGAGANSGALSPPSQLLHRTSTLDSKAAMAGRLLASPGRKLAPPAAASRTACARTPACTLSSGHAASRQPAQRSSQAQQSAAAAHAQRMQLPGVSKNGCITSIGLHNHRWGRRAVLSSSQFCAQRRG